MWTGLHRGHRVDDVDDAIWAVGYKLPQILNPKNQPLSILAIKSISDHKLNIEKLPVALRTAINQYHYKYGVGRVKDVVVFNPQCHFHQDSPIQLKCRQCKGRRAALRMAHLERQDLHFTRGALVRSWWRPPISERRMEPLVKIQWHQEPQWETVWGQQSVDAIQAVISQHQDPAVVAVTDEKRRVEQAIVHTETTQIVTWIEREESSSTKPSEENISVKPPSNAQKRERLRAAVCYQSSLLRAREKWVPTLRYAKLTDWAITPTRATERSAGLDLYSAYPSRIESGGKTLVKTDLQLAIPPGFYGRIAPRSGLAYKHFIEVGAGVVDEDYRGAVKVLLYNFSKVDFEIERGTKVAQIILERIAIPLLQEVPIMPTNTERGVGGFGASGR